MWDPNISFELKGFREGEIERLSIFLWLWFSFGKRKRILCICLYLHTYRQIFIGGITSITFIQKLKGLDDYLYILGVYGDFNV